MKIGADSVEESIAFQKTVPDGVAAGFDGADVADIVEGGKEHQKAGPPKPGASSKMRELGGRRAFSGIAQSMRAKTHPA